MSEERRTASSSVAPGAASRSKTKIRLTSVGVDIGSSTSHLVFFAPGARAPGQPLRGGRAQGPARVRRSSDSVFARRDHRSVALGAFIEEQYRLAKVDPRAIDTGAADPHRGRGAARERPRDRPSCSPAQAGKFVSLRRGRRARGDARGPTLGRLCALDPRIRSGE